MQKENLLSAVLHAITVPKAKDERRSAMRSQPGGRRPVGMFVCSMLIFGTIGVIRRYIPVSSAFLALSRGILGGLCILLFLRLKRKAPGEKLPRRALPGLIVSGALIGFNWMLLFEAFNYTTVAVATLCYYMAPTVVMLLSPLLFREKLTPLKAACAVAAVAGMALVSGVFENGGMQGSQLRGVLFGLGAAFLYAAVIILNKKHAGLEPYSKTTVQLISAGTVMIPYLLLTGGFRMEGMGAAVLLLVVGVVHTGLAYVLYFGSMESLRVQTIAILSYIDPVSALLFSALLLREPLSLLNGIGAVLVIGSAVVSELRKAES